MLGLTEGTIDYGSWKAFVFYQEMLEAKGYKPVNHTETDKESLHPEHLLWMCITMRRNIEKGNSAFPVDKYSRWLGFVQAGLIANKFTDVEQERNRTRTWLNEAESPRPQ